ncbi:MAG: hypothetical protein F6K08_00085 [Okeania sp. SIO1H6]|nr:hypothetical protein [Okeania sp. SIO1H6]
MTSPIGICFPTETVVLLVKVMVVFVDVVVVYWVSLSSSSLMLELTLISGLITTLVP